MRVKRAEEYGLTGELVAAAHELGMKQYGFELLKGFEEFFKGENGGFVRAAVNWEYSGVEKDIAEILAQNKHQIYLMPRTNEEGIKSVDVIIDGLLGEIKHPTSLNSVDKLTQKAIQQGAQALAIKPPEAIPLEEVIDQIKRRITREDQKSKRDLRVILIVQDKKVTQIEVSDL